MIARPMLDIFLDRRSTTTIENCMTLPNGIHRYIAATCSPKKKKPTIEKIAGFLYAIWGG
jgi:hypothetical protein